MTDYIRKLMQIVSMNSEYFNLCQNLFSHRFIAYLEMDQNRISDALMLRKEILGNGYISPASVLEVLVSFAMRIDREYTGEPGVLLPDVPFKDMIKNLGLTYETNERYNKRYVDEIIWRFVQRLYLPNGEGGIFPLINPSCDQTKIDLWSQMQEYLSEKYKMMER